MASTSRKQGVFDRWDGKGTVDLTRTPRWWLTGTDDAEEFLRGVLRKYSSAGQDNGLHSLSSENGTGLLPAASHYRGTRAQGPFSDSRQTRPSTRVTNADLT